MNDHSIEIKPMDLSEIQPRLDELERNINILHLDIMNIKYLLEDMGDNRNYEISIPHRCPVCNGETIDAQENICIVCDGKGIVWG